MHKQHLHYKVILPVSVLNAKLLPLLPTHHTNLVSLALKRRRTVEVVRTKLFSSSSTQQALADDCQRLKLENFLEISDEIISRKHVSAQVFAYFIQNIS